MTEMVKSFQELGEKLSGSGRNKHFDKTPLPVVEPVFLRKLVEIANGQAKAGKLIGLSGSHISTCLKANETRLTYELAAKAIIQEMEREGVRPTFYLVEVRAAQRDVVDAFLRGMNLKATTI